MYSNAQIGLAGETIIDCKRRAEDDSELVFEETT